MAEIKHRGIFVWCLLVSTLLYATNAQISQWENDVDNYFHQDTNANNVTNDIKTLSVGVIIAIAVGCILVLVLCISCCYCCCCRTHPPSHHTVVVAQNSAPAQPSTVVVAQAPQAVYNYPQTMGQQPMQQPPAGYAGPPPYPGQQSGYGYAKM